MSSLGTSKGVLEIAKFGIYVTTVPIGRMYFFTNNTQNLQKFMGADSSVIFWDNDSLAALLAMELNDDLFVLLSDVDGLYSLPPFDPRSKLLHTYICKRKTSRSNCMW